MWNAVLAISLGADAISQEIVFYYWLHIRSMRQHSCYQSSIVKLIDWLIDYVTIQSSQVVPSGFGRRFNLVSSNGLVN
jgi:hypothetical protein